MTKPKMILTGDAITIVLDGNDPFTMSREHRLFPKLIEALKAQDYEEVSHIIDIANEVEIFTGGDVTIRDGVVFYGNEAIHNEVAERILEFLGLGLDYGPMMNFLENLMQNPSFQSRQQLYPFLENGKMPITEDGRFIAYKWVGTDYYDKHSGTFLNKPGEVIKMPRGQVNDDRNQTCSSGLHVCTHGYERFGERLMLVAVNPAHVVSVPVDYNDSKMRVCEYEVLEEVSPDSFGNHQTRGLYAA